MSEEKTPRTRVTRTRAADAAPPGDESARAASRARTSPTPQTRTTGTTQRRTDAGTPGAGGTAARTAAPRARRATAEHDVDASQPVRQSARPASGTRQATAGKAATAHAAPGAPAAPGRTASPSTRRALETRAGAAPAANKRSSVATKPQAAAGASLSKAGAKAGETPRRRASDAREAAERQQAAALAQRARARGAAVRPRQPSGAGHRHGLLATAAMWLERADPYLRLCRLDRPIGFLLLLWPTWWGLWAAAEGFPPWHLLVIFTLGVVLMRSAGCVINDYADRWLDPQVKRTQTRPLAAGEVTPKQALMLFGGLLVASFVLVLFTNALTVKLAFVGALLAASYPFLKRYTHLPQVYLGIAFGWSIPMAFAAVQDEVPRLAWLLFMANILWSTAYDTLYAMVDRDDDIRAGAKSTAILFGDVDLVAVGMLHGSFLLTMLFVGQRLELGWPFRAALVTALGLCAAQLWRARGRDRDSCFRAFLDNNWVGMVVFFGLAGALALR
jgi:4-hydroxybenzoate polyprenyltransferase